MYENWENIFWGYLFLSFIKAQTRWGFYDLYYNWGDNVISISRVK